MNLHGILLCSGYVMSYAFFLAQLTLMFLFLSSTLWHGRRAVTDAECLLETKIPFRFDVFAYRARFGHRLYPLDHFPLIHVCVG